MLKWLKEKFIGKIADDILDNYGSVITQMGDGNIVINGKRYKGNNVMVTDNKIYIDGVLQNEEVSR